MKKLSSGTIACLNTIAHHQEKNGGFKSLTGSGTFKRATERETTFAASLILQSLASLKDTETVKRIAEKGMGFLLLEKSELWSFNYWQRESAHARTMPYPDDLDATFCALHAIGTYAPKTLTPEAFSAIIQCLTLTEEKPGGPYNTWIAEKTDGTPWHDIDVVVNANIDFFMKQQDVDLPELTALIDEAISSSCYTSRYYHSPCIILYFISRTYKGSLKDKAISFLLSKQKKDGTWGDPLITAMTVIALLNFGAEEKRLARALEWLETYAQKGKFDTFPVFIEESKNKTVYMGSPALTAAFVAEALVAYSDKIEWTKAVRRKPSRQEYAQALHQKILWHYEDRVSTFPRIANDLFLEACQRVVAFDKGKQVTLLPLYFLKSLKPEFRRKIRPSMLQTLGYANLAGWIAYTLYDDMLDDEAGPDAIPVANTLLREVSRIYALSFPHNDLATFNVIMDKLEHANLWERKESRASVTQGVLTALSLPEFGTYEVLAHKSLGHALSPLCILSQLGFRASSGEARHLEQFFMHYLIARQLNDDAHDWLDDLKRGFINSSAEKVLREFMDRNQQQFPLSFDISFYEKELQSIFWDRIIDEICEDIFRHVDKARAHLKKMKTFSTPLFFEAMLDPILRSAQEAQEEKQNIVAFLGAYCESKSVIHKPRSNTGK